VGVVRSVLATPDVRRLQLGWGLAVVGELAASIAVAVFAFDEGGAALVGVYGVARTLPGAVVAPVVMGLSDRLPKDRLLLLATGARAALLALAAALAAAHGPAPAVIGLAAGASSLAGTYRPLLISVLPWLVRSPAELGAVNVLATTMESSGALVGPLLAGALLARSSIGVTVAVAAGLLAVAAGLLAGVRLPRRPDGAPAGWAVALVADVVRGLRDMARVAPPAGMAVLLFAQTFVKGALGVLLVVLAVDRFGAGQPAVGWLYAAIGLGGLLGGVVAAGWVRADRLGRVFVTGLLLWGLPLALLAPAPSLVGCLAAMAVVGLGNAVQDVAGGTLTPRLFPPDVVGRVLGAEELVVFAGGAAGAAAAAPLIRVVGPRGCLGVLGLGLVVLVAAYVVRFVQIDRAAPVSGPTTDLIRGLPMFAPLPLAAVDLLASRLVAHDFATGEVVMREGDPGEDYHLILAGTAAVTVRSVARPDLGAGDGFGEIALLRDVPRTATVVAAEPLRTLALHRADFLAAVTGHPDSAATAEVLVRDTLRGDPSAGEAAG